MDGLPTGVVTFLLTDLVGSTELWDRAPGAMEVALRRHDEIVASTVADEGGTLLKARGEGDSSFSVFTRASDAVRAAHRLQVAIGNEAWSADAPLCMRVALHSGEAVERDGDFYGPAVNRAARLRSVAEGGSVLVGSTTASLVRNALPTGCVLTPLGEVELRGLDAAEPAFLLGGPGLRAAAPSTTASSSGPGPDVSPREADVLDLVRHHCTNAEIAARLYISERTVESHMTSLLRKFGVADRRALARAAAAPEAAPAGPSPWHGLLPSALELLADPSTYVGRAAERATLRDAWQQARGGHTVGVVVAGEAGMGKSRLVAELAAEVHADGGRVLLGASFEDLDRPYGPFVDVVAADAVDLDRDTARARAGEGADALASLSNDLTSVFAVPAPDASAPVARALVLDTIARWLAASAATQPLLVVVEDLHWSTSTTRDAFRHVLRRATRQPLLLVGTTRDTAPDLDDDLRDRLGELERLPSVRRVSLHGLERDEVATLAHTVEEEAGAILAETGGNPLLVSHVVVGSSIGGSLGALLGRRDGLLDDDARQALDLAATFGAEFDADLLVAGTGRDLLGVLDSLELAERARWIVPQPGRAGRFAFVHALFRSHRYDALPLRRRLELHSAAASALAARGDVRHLPERARHACLAVPLGDAREAVTLACRAGEAAERADAYDEAAVHYRRAYDVLTSVDPPDPHLEAHVKAQLGAALHHSVGGEGLAMLLEVAQEAQRAHDDEALVHAAVSIPQFGAILNPMGADPRFVPITEAALDALEDSASAARAVLLADLACHRLFASRVPEAVAAAREAERMARELGDADLLGRVLLATRHVAAHPSRLDDFERIARELLELGERLHRVPFTLGGTYTLCAVHLHRGELDEWRLAHRRMRAALADHRIAFFHLEEHGLRAVDVFLSGDLAEAERLGVEMGPLARSVGHPPGAWRGTIVALTRRLQGRDAELRPALERALARTDGMVGGQRCLLASVCARTGQHERAAAVLDELRRGAYVIPESYPWSGSYSEVAEAAEVLGDPEMAQRTIDQVQPYVGWISVSGPSVGRPFDQVLAQASLVVDPAAAEEHAHRAVLRSRERRTPGYLARELVFLAEARHRTGAPSSEVEPLVAEARGLAGRFGLGVVDVDLDRYALGP